MTSTLHIITSTARLITLTLLAALCGAGAAGQSATGLPADAETAAAISGFADLTLPDSLMRYDWPVPTAVDMREPVFDTYSPDRRIPPLSAPAEQSEAARYLPVPGVEWLDDHLFVDAMIGSLRQNYMIAHPLDVRYNERILPDPPKRYRAEIDPSTLTIVMVEVAATPPAIPGKISIGVERADWLHTFEGSLQFSQAYISPNWYQGGNNALSLIGNVSYSVKLNQKFHPNLMFENFVGYKLALSSTPDDSLRNYSVTEDIFQVITKAGVRAMREWFYSITLNFKTQFLNSYPVNSPDLAAAFLSPGELNMGLGMTYDHTSANKRFHINASISPLSWDLKTCINRRLDPVTFGIDEGRRTKNRFGSSTEIKLEWRLTRDILYSSRLFAFTEYQDSQIDWEYTLDFLINRFLSAKLYMHLHYDSTAPRLEDSRWHKWQFKEILSLGFNYRFSTI